MNNTRKYQFLTIAVIAALSLALFVKGYKSSSKTNEASIAGESASNVFDLDSYASVELSKLNKNVSSLIDSLVKLDNKEALQIAVQTLDSLNQPLLAAYYFSKYVEKEPKEMNWYVLGSKYFSIAATTEDSLLSHEIAHEAKSAFDKVIELNPQNLEAKNALAAYYIEVEQDVMKGVGMLREITSMDSNNLQAIFTLGMLSIQSGQFDKAQARFEKLIALQPFNAEYYYYLAESFAKSGNINKALATYEQCKTLLTDKEAKKEIDLIINKLKNS